MTYFYSLKSVACIITLMTTQYHIRHRPCKAFCQVYSMTAKSLSSGLVIMERKRTLQNSNLWYCHQNPTDDIELKLDENTILRPEKSVKALGVIIDNRLTFSDHISACCLKVARQLNALVRIAKYLDPKSKNVIYNSFIRSNFEYCPLVWHFCGKTNNNKLVKIQERSLRILHDTYELLYEELLNKNGSNTLLLHRLKLLIMETYKSFHCINANCLHGVFKFNSASHERRSDKLIQPKRRTNDLVNSDPAIANCDFNEIMVYLKQWEGPDINDSFPYVFFF